MKLLNPIVRCGGTDGCGCVFQFLPDSTVEEAKKVIAEHKAQRWHAEAVRAEREFKESVSQLRRDFPESK